MKLTYAYGVRGNGKWKAQIKFSRDPLPHIEEFDNRQAAEDCVAYKREWPHVRWANLIDPKGKEISI